MANFYRRTAAQIVEARGDIGAYDAVTQEAFDTTCELFPPIADPKRNDWLACHKEDGQTFDEFVASEQRIVPGRNGNTIYLLPLGEFDTKFAPPIEDLENYLRIFFAPVKVATLPPMPDVAAAEPKIARRRHQGHDQINAAHVVEYLNTLQLEDAFAIVGITMFDLYPDDQWNFVFGIATCGNSPGLGAFSFIRYHPKFFDKKVNISQYELTERERKDIVLRSVKVMSHEVGHIFGIHHCVYYTCLMNGGEHLEEFDAKPQFECPVCLRKLYDSCKFSIRARYERMLEWFAKYDAAEEIAWLRRRIDSFCLPDETS